MVVDEERLREERCGNRVVKLHKPHFTLLAKASAASVATAWDNLILRTAAASFPVGHVVTFSG